MRTTQQEIRDKIWDDVLSEVPGGAIYETLFALAQCIAELIDSGPTPKDRIEASLAVTAYLFDCLNGDVTNAGPVTKNH